MLREMSVSALFACAAAFASTPAWAQSAPEITLSRLDCGTQVVNDISGRFTDTFAYPGQKLPFTFSCYLIKHGEDYMLWDTGQSMSAGAPAPEVSTVDPLAQLKLKPEHIKYIGISHFHEKFESNGVPAFNYHRGDTAASHERFKKAAANLKATVVIQHDPRDIGKLPAFPAAAG